MGVDIWIPRYDYMYGHLTENEIDFIDDHWDMKDDETYYIETDDLVEIEENLPSEKKNKFKDLLSALRKQADKEGGAFPLIIF